MGAAVFYESASELARLSNTFTVSGTPTDPTTISLAVTDPEGTTTTYTYAAAQITRDSAGVYHKDIPCTLTGTWLYLWVGTGAAADAQAGTWRVSDPDAAYYATLAEMKSRKGIDDTLDDFEILGALAAITHDIDNECGRVFTRAATATAREYYPASPTLCLVHDFYTTTGLVVATDGGDGTYATTLTAADYQLEPLNGVVDGKPGWPYWKIRLVGGATFPAATTSIRAPVRATAKWGWAAIPGAVKEAALILASETFKLVDAPFGVAGFGAFGAVRVRDNPMAMRKLAPYRREPILAR